MNSVERTAVRLTVAPRFSLSHLSTMRKFNTAGPVRPDDHYCLPPLDRIDLAETLTLIKDKRYFVLHAPRQTGKTTALLALRNLLNGGTAGEYRCAYINVEAGQAAREDVGGAMAAIAAEIAWEAEDALGEMAMAEAAMRLDTAGRPHAALGALLRRWAKTSVVPLVLLIDEIDALVGDTLVSVLRQLRSGYARRPGSFPQSVVLCGVRDVRDYRIRASSEKEIITGGSAFNIKTESLRLGDFSKAEARELLGQHTDRGRPALRARGGRRGVAANPGPALAGQRPGARDVLQGRGSPRAWQTD